ncbi:MAG: hypothetical protein HYR85_06030 [Planctomycetes bacterium]|nr:hypothetical protein [Planctomycetota bacterium]
MFFVLAALVLGVVGIVGIYFRFLTVLASIAVEGGRMAIQGTVRLRSRPLLRLATYDQ